ncbi:MAG: hypothetical protein HY928_15010 [Elusimicrobia bacterium]|nr:hypothetical protein [Elusimicrobiota bacterium]
MLRRAGILPVLFALAACTTAVKSTPAPPAEPPAAEVPSDPDELLAAIQDSYGSGDFGRGLELVKRLVEITPDKVKAYDRIGSTYFALGRQADALGMWETALAMEMDPKRKTDLRESVLWTRRSLGLPEPSPPPVTANTPPPVKVPSKTPTTARKPDAKEAERLYRLGVDKYTRSEYLAATTLFMKALEADPAHEPSRKALERIKLKPAR